MKLIFPENILRQHLMALGKTGAGKSSALRHLVEHQLHQKKRLVVIDPKGDWYGLKWGKDGKSEGFPVILFGNFKEDGVADIAINDRSGEAMAELITSGNRPCVIGMNGWKQAEMTRWWIDFGGGLFKRNRGEIYVVGDEFHNFAPKGKILSPQAGECLHWSNRILSEGRGIGIVCLLASQRPQKVHNDTLTSCETLVAMRVVHKSDRDAVKDWIDGCGDKEQGQIVLGALAGMDRGEAFVWSPEVAYGPERVKFPMFETFDSFAPPQLQKKVSSASWENVDLSVVKEKLAAVIEEAQANDPAELKRKLAEAERKLKIAEQKSPQVKEAVSKESQYEIRRLQKALEAIMKILVEITTHNFDAASQGEEIKKAVDAAVNSALSQINKRLEHRQAEFDRLKSNASKMLAQIKDSIAEDIKIDLAVRHNEPFSVASRQPFQSRRFTKSNTQSNGGSTDDAGINSTQQRILDALAWFESVGNNQPSTLQVGAVALIDSTGGYFSNMVGPLSANGLIDRGNGVMSLTDAGRKIAQVPDNISTLADYHAMLCERVRKLKSAGGKTVEILEVIIAQGPEGEITTEEIGQQVQVDHTGGYFSNMIGPLGGLGLIERNRGIVRPTEILFPPGLA